MKAKVIKTGEIVDVVRPPYERKFYRKDDSSIGYEYNELEFIDDNIDWEQRRFVLVKAVVQGTMAKGMPKGVQLEQYADACIVIADAVIAKLKEG